MHKLRSASILFRSDRAALYSAAGLRKPVKEWLARRYLAKHDISKLLTTGDIAEYGVTPHKMIDLVYLHQTIRRLRPKVVVELGCGFSSVVMAHALSMNKKGALFIVEADKRWAGNVWPKLRRVGGAVEMFLTSTPASLKTINGQLCHTFDTLPNVRPDIMYVDGCDPKDVHGMSHGLSMQGLKFAVSADPLLYEWAFYPGAKVIVDGRYTNVQFLKQNFRRRWAVKTNYFEDRAVFTLLE